MTRPSIIDARRNSIVYEDNDDALRINQAVLYYEERLQALGELKIKEYHVFIEKLHEAQHLLKKGTQPQLPQLREFTATIFVDEEDEKPFHLTEEGIIKKINQLEARIEELQELLRLRFVD